MNKYIIVKEPDGKFVMHYANTDFHRGMVGKYDIPFGGGMFSFSDDDKEMTLWGRSDDFGEPRFKDIKEKIHTDEELDGVRIILGNIRPSTENHQEDITDKFIFDEY